MLLLADEHLLRRALAVDDKLVDVRARGGIASGTADFAVPVADVFAAGERDVLEHLTALLQNGDGDELCQHVVDAYGDDVTAPRSLHAREREGDVGLRIDGIRVVLSERPCPTPSGLQLVGWRRLPRR